MNEADLVKIRTALEKESLGKACEATELALIELGWRPSGLVANKREKTIDGLGMLSYKVVRNLILDFIKPYMKTTVGSILMTDIDKLAEEICQLNRAEADIDLQEYADGKISLDTLAERLRVNYYTLASVVRPKMWSPIIQCMSNGPSCCRPLVTNLKEVII